MKLFYFVLLISSYTFGQIDIQYLNDVPQSFKDKYYSQPRVYNPLHVGNIWQYYDAEYKVYSTIKILQDSIINGKKYFKKSSFPEFTLKPDTNISWERNDTTNGVSFMLDFEDINDNGNFLEELPLDSLENPYWSRYTTYKYSFNDPFFWSGEKTTHVKDTSWVIIDGDTVLSRNFEIIEIFWAEEIIEKFGIIWNWSESPARYCTGAIFNGKQYGTIVSVNDNFEITPTDFLLENNYPNPFNPSTTINFSIPSSQSAGNQYHDIKLIVYDVLGNKIAVLVNEPKTAGNYSVNFNAAHLSSGIYYYSLITNSKKITKPMLLIK